MTSTAAAEKIGGTSYLLEEILIRLPAKSVARSKLVSKQWLSQISNPQFLQLHSRHRPNKLPTGMFLTDSKSISSDAHFVSFRDMNPTYQTIPSLGFLYEGMKHLFGDEFSEIKLLNSCNGLLLCLVNFISKPWEFIPTSYPKYCVCNPTTKKFRWLPAPPFSVSSIQNSYLAFDPSLSLHYKVICTKFFNKSHRPYDFYIYSSVNQCWTTYTSPFDPRSRSQWVFLNGSMYCAENSLCFHVYTENMKQITMPPKTRNYLKDCLPVIGNRVYYAIRKDDTTTDLQVEMSSDFYEWVPKYDANVSPLLSAFPEIDVSRYEHVHYCFDAICVVEGVKEDDLGLVLGIPGKVILYNLKEKTAKELCALHGELSGMTGYSCARVYQFIECLSDV